MSNYRKNDPPPIGETFGKLVVMAETVQVGYRMMYCICACGNTTIKPLPNLKRGYVKSCGCLRKNPERKPK